jgi:outer membrane protein assembly factor BamB
VPINGRVYSFDRKTGKQQWTADVQHQLFQVCQPADLPVLTFLNSVDPDFAERGRGGSRLVCLDARTGKVLHEQTAKDVRTMQFSVVGDPDAGRVELATGLGNVTFRYAAAPK